ncbi:MAG TPA: SAM hydroxide adenosyltransferase, partial [Candidatus Caenarcaniphilales bacterium]|nr:SAM hydroxide adenosyltransferase [Candidatus Caenarcaniphilales bacterium]
LSHGDRLAVEFGAGRHTEQLIWASTFGDVAAGRRLLYEDSYGRLCLAENQGSATDSLGLRDGLKVTIRRPALQAAE